MPSLLDQSLLYVTGKGGVGKTTVALALALAARDAGRRVAVCEVAGQGRIASMYGRAPLPDGRELELAPGLFAVTVDPLAALREWFATMVPQRLAGVLSQSGTFGAFVQAAPGARELTTAAKVWELGQPRRWTAARPFDTVVLDAPASGHGLGLLRAPATFAAIAPVGPLGHQAAAVRDAFADEGRTAVVAVAQPAELSVSETLELEARHRLGAIVVNGLLPRRFTRAEVERVGAAVDGTVGALVARTAADVRGQQAQLRRLRRDATAPVHTLPFVAAPGLDVAAIELLARRLTRD